MQVVTNLKSVHTTLIKRGRCGSSALYFSPVRGFNDTEVSHMSPPEYHNENHETSDSSDTVGTLVGVRFIGAQKPLVHALGLNAAVYLNECLYWQARVGIQEWFNRTSPQMHEETGLSKHEQAKAREILRDRGLIEERKGVNFRNQTRIDQQAFAGFLQALAQTRDENAVPAVKKTAADIQQSTKQPSIKRPLAVKKTAAHITY